MLGGAAVYPCPCRWLARPVWYSWAHSSGWPAAPHQADQSASPAPRLCLLSTSRVFSLFSKLNQTDRRWNLTRTKTTKEAAMKCKKDQIPSVENFNIINQFCINIKDKRNPLQTIIVLNRNGQNFQLPKNGTVLDPNFNRLNKLLFGTFHIQIGKLYIKALTHQKDDYGSCQKKVNAGRLRNAHYW